MTLTDTLKLYTALHAEVPETQPKHEERGPLVIYDDTYGNWIPCWENEFIDERGPYANEAIALCRCAALEWACKTTLCDYAAMQRFAVAVQMIMQWYCGGASDDSRLIDICKAIHAAKGANRD